MNPKPQLPRHVLEVTQELLFAVVSRYEDDFKRLRISVAGVELGKLRSETSARRAPVGAEIKEQRGLALEGPMAPFVINKPNLGDERRNSCFC